MPSKIIRKALWETLENLTSSDYEKFCHALLLHNTEGKRVSRIKVQGKNYLDVTDAIVSTFTESGALEVAVQTLRDIGCNQEAQSLCEMTAEDLGAQSSKPGSSDSKHFVDKHQIQLKSRVSNIAPILDELLQKDFIDQENYDRIRKLPTSQEKMRELYSGCLRASTACKDIFYEALKKNEPFLIAELKKYN